MASGGYGRFKKFGGKDKRHVQKSQIAPGFSHQEGYRVESSKAEIVAMEAANETASDVPMNTASVLPSFTKRLRSQTRGRVRDKIVQTREGRAVEVEMDENVGRVLHRVHAEHLTSKDKLHTERGEIAPSSSQQGYRPESSKAQIAAMNTERVEIAPSSSQQGYRPESSKAQIAAMEATNVTGSNVPMNTCVPSSPLTKRLGSQTRGRVQDKIVRTRTRRALEVEMDEDVERVLHQIYATHLTTKDKLHVEKGQIAPSSSQQEGYQPESSKAKIVSIEVTNETASDVPLNTTACVPSSASTKRHRSQTCGRVQDNIVQTIERRAIEVEMDEAVRRVLHRLHAKHPITKDKLHVQKGHIALSSSQQEGYQPESSKAQIVAMEEANETDSDVSMNTTCVPLSSSRKRRRGHRGQTLGRVQDKIIQTREGRAIEVEMDENVGRVLDQVHAKHLATTIGVAARQLPLVTDWRHQKKESIKHAIDFLQLKVHVKGMETNVAIQGAINSNLGRLMREHRCKIHKRYIKIGDAAKPPTMTMDVWRSITNYWESKEFKVRSEQAKHARSCVKNLHCSGTTSYAVRRAIIEEKEENPIGPIRLFLETHFVADPSGEGDPDSVTGVTGRWMTLAAKETYCCMLKAIEDSKAIGEHVDEQDVCNEILMPNGRSDYNVGLGYGTKSMRKLIDRGIAKQQLKDALKASQEALKASETARANQDGEIRKLKKQQKMMRKQHEEKMKVFEADLVAIKKLFERYNPSSSTRDSIGGLIAGFSSLSTPQVGKGKRKRIQPPTDLVGSDDEEEDPNA